MGQARKAALGRGSKKPWAEICVCIGMRWQKPGSQRHLMVGETREGEVCSRKPRCKLRGRHHLLGLGYLEKLS